MRAQLGEHWTAAMWMVVYWESEYSFGVQPHMGGSKGIGSALINDLQLEVNDEGVVLYVWGLCTHPSRWHPTNCNPPDAARRRLQLMPNGDWTPGISQRLNAELWDVFVNQKNGWVCVGENVAAEGSCAVECAPDTIVVIEENSIVALWLRPEQLPTTIRARCSESL